MSPRVRKPIVTFATPDFSKVKSKVFNSVRGSTSVVARPSKRLHRVNKISTSGPQTPSTSRHWVSQKGPFPEDYLRLLQEDTSPMPIDYAGVEKAIDKLQQEAKAILHSDISEVKCSVYPGLTREGSKVTPSESVQSRRLEGDGLYAQTAKHDRQLQQVKAVLQSGNLQASEWLQHLMQLEQRLDSLQTRYMDGRNLCHRLSKTGTKIFKFDPNLELLSVLLQCEVYLMEMKEPLVHMTHDQPSAPPPASTEVGQTGDSLESVSLSLEESGPSEREDEDGEEIPQEEDVSSGDVSPDCVSSLEVVSLEDDCPQMDSAEDVSPDVVSPDCDSSLEVVSLEDVSPDVFSPDCVSSLEDISPDVFSPDCVSSLEVVSLEDVSPDVFSPDCVSSLEVVSLEDVSPEMVSPDVDSSFLDSEDRLVRASTASTEGQRTPMSCSLSPASTSLRYHDDHLQPLTSSERASYEFSSSRARKPRPQRTASSPTSNEGGVPGVRGHREVRGSLIDSLGQTSRAAAEKKIGSRRRVEVRTQNGASGGSRLPRPQRRGGWGVLASGL